jgi:phosphoethanolamine N-methyltransferase
MLKPGGVVIMREDLGSQPARLIVQLTQFLDLFAAEISGDTTGFQLYSMNQVQDSIHAHSNFLDVYWTLAKQSASGGGGNADVNGGQAAQKLATFREFLDQTQYTQDNVKTYEYIFGENFISPGGLDENRRVLNYLCSPYPGQRMLDIGVGIGGGARQAAVVSLSKVHAHVQMMGRFQNAQHAIV